MTNYQFADFCRRHRPLSFGFAMRELQLAMVAALVPESVAIGMLQAQAQIRVGARAAPRRPIPMFGKK